MWVVTWSSRVVTCSHNFFLCSFSPVLTGSHHTTTKERERRHKDAQAKKKRSETHTRNVNFWSRNSQYMQQSFPLMSLRPPWSLRRRGSASFTSKVNFSSRNEVILVFLFVSSLYPSFPMSFLLSLSGWLLWLWLFPSLSLSLSLFSPFSMEGGVWGCG